MYVEGAFGCKRRGWQVDTVRTLLSRFEEKKDVNGAESLVEILKKVKNKIGAEIFESLIRTYAAAGKSHPAMHRGLKMENVEVSEARRSCSVKYVQRNEVCASISFFFISLVVALSIITSSVSYW
ncbi:unnamed protein product [Microthlaspi erraticum]|uniref:Uncharacterized protein n=1 Tax=Microthlaspi erraticum TaxID=1685480 RepID=A0A6D2IXS6_9BRAS|nr:unnamed protein product [Microthlaspi erraticum]